MSVRQRQPERDGRGERRSSRRAWTQRSCEAATAGSGSGGWCRASRRAGRCPSICPFTAWTSTSAPTAPDRVAAGLAPASPGRRRTPRRAPAPPRTRSPSAVSAVLHRHAPSARPAETPTKSTSTAARRGRRRPARRPAPAHAELAREARRGLDPGAGHRGDHRGEEQVVPARAACRDRRVGDQREVEQLRRAPITTITSEQTTMLDQRQPQHAAVALGREAAEVRPGHVARSRPPAITISGAALVRPRPRTPPGSADTANAADRHHDQVVEEDRPAGHEAPQLVERVAGERRTRRPARGAGSCPRRRSAS